MSPMDIIWEGVSFQHVVQTTAVFLNCFYKVKQITTNSAKWCCLQWPNLDWRDLCSLAFTFCTWLAFPHMKSSEVISKMKTGCKNPTVLFVCPLVLLSPGWCWGFFVQGLRAPTLGNLTWITTDDRVGMWVWIVCVNRIPKLACSERMFAQNLITLRGN